MARGKIQHQYPVIMRICRSHDIWEEVQECPECHGSCSATLEVPVIDYMHGGFLTERDGECPTCDGRGWIELEEPDDD
jgi:DnaJ-class molecular chaperone